MSCMAFDEATTVKRLAVAYHRLILGDLEEHRRGLGCVLRQPGSRHDLAVTK